MKRYWKALIALAWVTVVFVFFFRQYAEKVFEKLGM
jgi:hypothetical protein